MNWKNILAGILLGAATASATEWGDAFVAITNRSAAVSDAMEAEYPVETDWLRQDFGTRELDLLASTNAVAIVNSLTGKALAEIGKTPARSPVVLRDALVQYADACRQRRRARLANLCRQVPRVVFTKHYNMGGSHYAYTEGQSDAQNERTFHPGAALCLLEMTETGVVVQELLRDDKGVIRDPDVSPDGARILFSWKKSLREDDYHLYEMEVASRRIRQLTTGLGVADYEGAYLADGDIIFNSTRCVQTVDCWWTEVSNLYRCDKDGQHIRRLTFDQVHDNYPTVTDDGRILYTRWEYNDRGQIYPQPLLQMNPDGTGQTGFYGGNSWFPTTILHARGIPGTQKVVAIATGHHTLQAGKLILIDPSKGRQEAEGVQLVAPVRETKAVRVDQYGQDGELFQYPYPLCETEFLVAYHPVGWGAALRHSARGKRGGMLPRFGVYWMHVDGRRELLASDPDLPCNQPVPLQPRTIHLSPSLVDNRESGATCYIQDVYAGPGLAGIARGTVKTLRVVSLEFRAAGIGWNGSSGPGGGALSSTPVSIGNGAWDPKVILGDIRVEEDGSAFFRVPARRPIYFQMLDVSNRVVQTMRSWTTLQPGEKASCVGCHESPNSVPPVMTSKAVLGAPESLCPFYGEARGFSFGREIQPILDRHCVKCHTDGKDKPFPLDATPVVDPTAKRAWSRSYLQLTHSVLSSDKRDAFWRGDAKHPVVNWISAQSAPPLLPPNSAGANQSRLMKMLDDGHKKVKLDRESLDKLAAWIDLGVPFCGDYEEAAVWTKQEREEYRHFLEKRERLQKEE